MLFITEQRQPPREVVVTSLTKLSLWGCGRASATLSPPLMNTVPVWQLKTGNMKKRNYSPVAANPPKSLINLLKFQLFNVQASERVTPIHHSVLVSSALFRNGSSNSARGSQVHWEERLVRS